MIKRKKYQWGVVVKNKTFGDKLGGKIKAQFGIKQLRNDNSNNDMGFNVYDNKLHPNEVKDKNIYGASKKFGTYLTYPEKVNRVRNINKISGNPYVLNEPIDDRDIDTSGYFRAHATNDLNSIHIPKNNPEQIISEYPHTYQFKNVPKEQYDKKFNYDIELNDKDHEKTYNDKNSTEYEAHHIIEPVFEGYIRGNLKDTNDVKRFIDYRNQLNNKPYKEIPYQGGNPVDNVVSNPNGNFGWARNVFLEEQGYPKDTVSKYPKNIVENYIEDKLGGEPYSLNRNLNPKYKSLEVKKHGGTINKRKQLKSFNMTNKYEYGGRIGDESFIGRTSNIGPFRGIDYKRKKKNKISISTMQPKWALNNGAIPSYHNLGLQVKAKMGGNIKKYQYAGTADSTRGNAGYSSEGKQSVTNINPQFTGGYGNTAVTFNPNLRITGNKITDKRLNAGLMHSRANFDVNSNYTNDNSKKLFNNNIEYNNGVFNAGVNSTIGTNQKPVYGINSGLKFNGIDAQGGFEYGNNKRKLSAAVNVNGYRGSGNVLYNRVYDEKTGDATTNVGAVYTGRKGLTAGANYSNSAAGQSASGNLGYKDNNGYIQANATFNPNNTNVDINEQYSNQGTTKSGKQWHVGVKGGMNFKNKMGGKILAQSGVTIPDSTYYAKAESTSTPLYKNNKVNALKLAEKRRREEEAERLNQGTITQGTYNPSQPTHMESVKNRLDNTDLAASTLHIPQYAATETYNHFVNKQPFNWGHLKPGAHGITPSDLMHIQNPYGRLAADLILDPLNFGPGILGHTLTGIKQIKNLGKAVEIANATAKLGDAANATNKAINVGNVGYNIAKGFAKDAAHMGEHIITHPIHGPAAMQRSFDYTINKDSTKKVADGDVGIKHHKLGGIIKKKRNIKWAGQ